MLQTRELWRPQWVADGGDQLAQAARVFLENRVGREWERISPYQMTVGEDGPNFEVDLTTELGILEYKALMRIRELAMNGCKYIVWISPAGGRSDYIESRMVVAVVDQIDGGEVNFNCRGIALETYGHDLLLPAGKLLVDGGNSKGDINCVEDLRDNPIGFNLPVGVKWTEYLAIVFGRNRIWQEIQTGRDVDRQDKIIKELRSVYVGLGGRVNDDWIMFGAMMEQQMIARGYVIAGGNHGATLSSMTSRQLSLSTSFDSVYGVGIGLIVVDSDSRRRCGCGAILNGNCKVCPVCGAKFE